MAGLSNLNQLQQIREDDGKHRAEGVANASDGGEAAVLVPPPLRLRGLVPRAGIG